MPKHKYKENFMINVKAESFKEEVIEQEGLVVIDLWAPWCGPCRMLAPILEELESEYPDVKFCKINVDEEAQLAQMFGVQSIPMVAFVKNDVFLDMSVGFVPKDKLSALIEEYK